MLASTFSVSFLKNSIFFGYLFVSFNSEYDWIQNIFVFKVRNFS